MNKKPSISEPVTELRKIKIIECGEPLVDYLKLCPQLLVGRSVWNYQRLSLLRESVAEKLCLATKQLPKNMTFMVVEGWRPPHIQKRMHLSALQRWRERHPDWSEHKILRTANRFTAPPHPKVPPPHTTGGALDVVLGDTDGNELDMVSPYERRDPKAYPFDAQGLSDTARKHRLILKEALASVGITNYPSEFWHYSFGDQGWAYRGGHEHAIYGSIVPENYTPPKDELIDEPLEWIADKQK